MTIAGHRLREEAGNNTILATPTLRHTTLAITREAHNHPLFHLNIRPIHQMPGNLIEGISIINNNKVRLLITTVRLLIIMVRLNNNPTAIIHQEERFVEP